MDNGYPKSYQPNVDTHYIEDMRHRKRMTVPTNSTQKKKRPSRKIVLGVLIVLAVFCASLLAADYLVPQGIASYVVNALAHRPDCVYAVSAGSYDTLDQAQAVSNSAREMGGAGFVAFDGKYNVLLAAYNQEEEASQIAERNGYALFPIYTEGLNESDFPLRVRSSLKSVLGYHINVFEQLYDWSVQLAESGTTVPYVKQRVAAIQNALQRNAQGFLDATESETDATTLNYRSTLLGVLGALENLANRNCSDNLFLAELRWTYILVLRVNRA